MSDLVSVIVPVYNVQKYLPRCIESILNQTYKNIEIILVDDGSPDKSGEICDYYAKKDSRVIVVHKENGGVSSARNAGLDIAKGKFINFVDSDDWISVDAIEAFVKLFNENDVDLVVGSLANHYLEVSSNSFKEELVDFYNKNDDVGLIIPKFKMPVNKLYVKSIIDSNKLKFQLGIKAGEDALFVYEYLKYCKKVFTSSKTTYHYNRLGDDSATKKRFTDIISWKAKVVESYYDLLRTLYLSNSQKIIAVDREACFEVYFCIQMWMNILKNDKVKIKEKINEIITVFEPYLLFEEKNILTKSEEIKKVIYTKNIDLIYSTYKNYRNKTFLRSKLRKIFAKLIRPYIEKKRDNLIDYKKILKNHKKGLYV